jgi:TRAP-type C4-dicarboxylate transport system substrate-binding protein
MSRMIIPAMVAAVLGFGAQSASAQVAWDLVNEYPPNSIHAQAADRFIELLSEKSGGSISVTAHHGAALGYKSVDQFDAVGDGAVQVASSFIGPWAGIDPAFILTSLPFLAPTTEDAFALYKAAKPTYEKVLEDANQVMLFATPWPPSGFWGNKPVDSMEALKGMRIRTFDASGTTTLKAAGAAPIQLSWADVVPQLMTKGIDGVLTSADGGAASQLWEHQSHFTEVNYALPLQIVHVNKDAFESLSEEQRKAVTEAASEAEAYGWELVVNRVQENYEQMRSHGMTIVEKVSPDFIAELTKAGQLAVDDWKSKMGASGEEILKAYEEARKN